MKRIVFPLLILVIALSASFSFAADGFRVLDIGEREYENGPALSVLFSEPLSRGVRQDGLLRVTVGTGLQTVPGCCQMMAGASGIPMWRLRRRTRSRFWKG